MKIAIRDPKDFWLGTAYLLCGGAGLWLGTDYPLGSAARMGPGYFPTVIASFLLAFGVASIIRSLVSAGEPIRMAAVKPLVLITGGIVAFGLLLNTLGLVIALALLIFVSAAASDAFRLEWRAIAGVFALIVFCSAVFVKGLGVPMPLVGDWLAPYLPTWMGGG